MEGAKSLEIIRTSRFSVKRNRRWIFDFGRVMDGAKSLQFVRASRPRKETDGGFLVLGVVSKHSSLWRSHYRNRRVVFALFRLDDLPFPILYL